MQTNSLLKYIITIYSSWILFVRSFFIKEHPRFIPLLLIIGHLNLYFNIIPSYDIKALTYWFLWLGIYCIGIDTLGSIISSHALQGTSSLFDQVIPFLTQERKSYFVNYYLHAGITALIIGKTPMTSTGRAALGVGVISGIGYLINAHLDRQHQGAQNARQREWQGNQAQQQREWQEHEAQRQRDWEDARDRQKAYESSWNPFRKPPE
jgi:hypothetical protein